jgi:hypothetical protein
MRLVPPGHAPAAAIWQQMGEVSLAGPMDGHGVTAALEPAAARPR